MSRGVFSWWLFLCAVGALNVIAWSFAAAALRRHQGAMSSDLSVAVWISISLVHAAMRQLRPREPAASQQGRS